MLQFGSKHVYIEDVHIFKHCHEMTLFLLWIGTYCISCVVQQTSGVKDLSSLVRYDDSSLAVIRHVQSIVPIVRPRPNIRSHSVLSCSCFSGLTMGARERASEVYRSLPGTWLIVYVKHIIRILNRCILAGRSATFLVLSNDTKGL